MQKARSVTEMQREHVLKTVAVLELQMKTVKKAIELRRLSTCDPQELEEKDEHHNHHLCCIDTRAYAVYDPRTEPPVLPPLAPLLSVRALV
jgi:hypothetical protein